MHFVLGSLVIIAFSSSSKPPLFFNFLTRLLTAFSDHFSSLSASPFFQPNNFFTMGGVNWSMEVTAASEDWQCCSMTDSMGGGDDERGEDVIVISFFPFNSIEKPYRAGVSSHFSFFSKHGGRKIREIPRIGES